MILHTHPIVGNSPINLWLLGNCKQTHTDIRTYSYMLFHARTHTNRRTLTQGNTHKHMHTHTRSLVNNDTPIRINIHAYITHTHTKLSLIMLFEGT